MKLQCALVVVAGLGLAGCGGGGGGGSSDSDRGSEPVVPQVKAADLVGTWVQTNNIYFESTPGTWEWLRTRRQTIIVEQSGSGLLFTNCVSDDSLESSVSNNVVTFPVQSDVAEAFALDVVDASTITGTVAISSSLEAEVELRKVSSDTTVQQASANLTVTALTIPQVSVTRSTWDELCVESQVQAQPPEYFAEFKAQTTVSDSSVVVGIRFDSTTPFANNTFVYPGAAMNVSGSFDAPAAGLAGELYDPVSGTVGISTIGSAHTFTMTNNFVMPSDQGVNIRISGTINLNSTWFAGEPE